MRKITRLLLLICLLVQGYVASSQDIDFNVRYNGTTDVYEVYARPAFTDAFYFVGGGTQISVLVPESALDVPLVVTPVNGGVWTDNSQVYAPAADVTHDYHGVATNGAPISFVAGQEILLYTFTITGASCLADVRLFENATDPGSGDAGMNGGDFLNFFANVFDPFTNNWRSNYYNTGVTCPEAPVVISNPITVPQDSAASLCMPILDINITDTFTASLCTGSPANGAAVLNVTGNTLCLDYTPTIGYAGLDDVCIIVCDVSSECDTVSVPVTVIPLLEAIVAPEPPVVIVTPMTTPEDSTVNVCTEILDHNVGDTFTASFCTGSPANGTATATVSGNILCLEYSPNVAYTGDDDLCVIVCDQTGLCDTVSVPVSVIPTLVASSTAQAPIVIMPPVVTPEDNALTVCGPVIDVNVGDTHTVSICGQPVNGTATASIDNANNSLCVTVDPDPNFTGSDSLCVTVCDQGALCYTLMVPIEVTPENDPPLAINDINSTQINNPVSGNVLTNDSDPEGDGMTVSTTPMNETNGTVTINALGVYTFTPTIGFLGDASFQYEVCDNGAPSKCDTATVIIEVIDNTDPDNNDVVGMPDNFIMEEGDVLTANVLSNDSDPDGDNLVINTTVISGPSNGAVTIAVDGTIVYTPTPTFVGTDVFTYEVCDDGTPSMCDVVTVTIEVIPNDGINNLFATDDANSGEESQLQSGNVTDNDNDPEGGLLTVNTTPVVGVANGTLTLNANGSYTYLPNAGFIGNDQFVYTVCDNGTPTACDNATVYITVIDSKYPPVVIPNALSTPQDSSATVCMPITDPNVGDTFSSVICTGSPTNGTATSTVSGGTVCVDYTPTPGYNGPDDICMIVCDQTGRCDTVSVPVTVVPPIIVLPTPEPPIVIVTPITTPEDSTANVCTPILDPNVGDTFTAAICTGSPANGTATATVAGSSLCLEYTPTLGYSGSDDICVIVCDQTGLCDTVSVPVTVIPTPLPPDTLQAPILVMAPLVTPEDINITGCGPVIDANAGDTHTVTICQQPTNGNVVAAIDNGLNEVCLTFDPDPSFYGSDSVCVIVCDQTSLCDTLVVPIEVLPLNDAPMAINDINNTQVNIPTSGNVLTNDSDAEGDNMTVSTTPINPTNGTVTINAAGIYTFTPDPGFIGTGTFQYEVCDDGVPSGCDTATVVIAVIDVTDPANNSVVGTPDNFVTEDDTPLTGDLLSNDSDPDGDVITINTTPVTSPANGTLTINPDGTFIYTPVLGVTGTETFTYEVCDNGVPQACADVLVTIEVLPTNGVNSLYATDDSSIGNEDDPQTGNVTLNDNDPEGDNLTVNTTPLTGPSNGIVTILSNGNYTYQPTIGFIGNDQFTYVVCDDGTPSACDSATVYLTVLNVATDLRLKVMLQGALFATPDGLMRADLVTQNLVPLTEPHAAYGARFTHVIGGGETTTNPILTANAGTPDGIVDWVFVELRDATDSVTVIRTLSALVQRDGDVVDAATGGTIYVNDLPDNFFVVIKHRNHLGAMTGSPVATVAKIATFDFSTAAAATLYHNGAAYDGLEQVSSSGHEALWAGNANGDAQVKYDSGSNDRIIITSDVITHPGNTSFTLNYDNAIDYFKGDINMDGKSKYDGIGNDRILIQSIILTYPLNTSYLNNYNNLVEQVR